MSIPVTIDPLGTLGAVRELPYVQPNMLSNTNVDPANPGSFGVVFSLLGSHSMASSYDPFRLMSDYRYAEFRIKPTAYGCRMVFAKDLKITSLTIKQRITSPEATIEFWGIGDKEKLLFTDTITKGGSKEYLYMISSPSYYKIYELRISYDMTATYADLAYGADKLKLEAVYRP